VRGDVVNADDVINAVQACVATGKLIGGVVQAAMGLQEALFSRMTNSSWQKGVQPKWSGTWNIHNALEGHDEALDFLLLTSSVSGTVGTATESNYCAANGFLDAFAQWRRNQGKPAISIGLGMISEVGYLHENPEVENLLLRKGIQPLNEDEFLQVVDLGLAQGDSKADGIQSPNDSSVAHILTGLELSKMEELIAQGFDISFGVLRDPRAALLAASSVAMREERDSTLRNTLESDGSAEIPWLKGLPPQVADITKKIDAASLDDAILIVVRKQFSNLTLMPIQQIDDRKPLVQFGLDSMIASEFRAWLWSTLKVDVSFLDILSRKLTLRGLAKSITEDLPRV
jgi:aryl carrier-like protein